MGRTWFSSRRGSWGAIPAVAVTLVATVPAAGPALAAAPATATAPYRILATVATGNSPFDVAADSRSGLAYVTNQASATVTVIQGSTGKVIATIPVRSAPGGIAVNPATNRIYVADPQGYQIISGARNKVIMTVTAASQGTASVAVDKATDTVYLTDLFHQTVLAIDGSTGAIMNTIGVGHFPDGVTVDQNTDTAYVANSADGTVSVINCRTNEVTGTITVGGVPGQLAVNQQTDTVYVPDFQGDTLTAINGQTDAVAKTIHITGLIAAAADWRTDGVFVSRMHEMSVINGKTGVKTQTIRIGRAPNGIAVDNGTGIVYVANENDGTVTLLTKSRA
jgi:YVTN family beta-propeller protein